MPPAHPSTHIRTCATHSAQVLEIFRKEEEKFILLMPETIKDLEWMVINIFFPNMQQMLDFLFDTLCRVGPCNGSPPS